MLTRVGVKRRAVVLHLRNQQVVVMVQQQLDLGAAVANRVVHEVGEHFAQQDGGAVGKKLQRGVYMVFHAQRLACGHGVVVPARDGVQNGLDHIKALWLSGRVFGNAGKSQQLLDHACTARGDLVELSQHLGIHGLLGVRLLNTPHITDEQANASHGGLQLVGRIGNEAALLADGYLQALQQ